MALDVVRQHNQRREDAQRLDEHPLAVVKLRFGAPPQERRHVLGDLRRRRRRSVGEFERLHGTHTHTHTYTDLVPSGSFQQPTHP